MTIKEVLMFACNAHAGQVDKAGCLYRNHLIRVAGQMETQEEIVVALLHDVLEDTDLSWQDLEPLGLSEAQRAAICLLTRSERETYEEYIDLVKQNPLARKVKIADLHDHLADPAPLTAEQAAKYLETLASLCEM